ncbi:hypothetical protein EOPP23_11185 [Endozoicomonas sp. OPT23]|nr:hypothetical protein [Endozoicomonas sp. OPT23]
MNERAAKAPSQSRNGRVSVVEDVKPKIARHSLQPQLNRNLDLHMRGIRVIAPHEGGGACWYPKRKAPPRPDQKPLSNPRPPSQSVNANLQSRQQPALPSVLADATKALIDHRSSTVPPNQNRNEAYRDLLNTYHPNQDLDDEEYSELEYLLVNAANNRGEKLPQDKSAAIKELKAAIYDRLRSGGSKVMASKPTPPKPPVRSSSLPESQRQTQPVRKTVSPELLAKARTTPTLRPTCHNALLDALNGNNSPEDTRKQVVQGYADYYSSAQTARRPKESQDDYVLNLVKTIQQQASQTSDEDLAPLRGLIQRDISGDVDTATNALGMKTMESEHAFDTFKAVTGVTINRQVGTAQLTGKANPTGEGAQMAKFSMVDTREIDSFVRDIQSRQEVVISDALRTEVTLLKGIKNPEKVWKKLEKTLRASLRNDMQRSINPALNGASTKEKAKKIQAGMEKRLAERVTQSREIFMNAVKPK